jgi:hypothetical protein
MEIGVADNSFKGITQSSQTSHSDKKKGMTLFNLPLEEEKKYLSYKPRRPDLVDWVNLRTHSDFNIKCYKESTYMGLLDPEKKRSGRGVITYNSGRYYEGHWRNDLRHGQGFEHFMTGNTYEGEYKNGKVDGQGRYNWANGEFYEGLWKQGLKSGYGLWQGKDQYVGEWADNQPNGFGKHTWNNGDFYEGEWKHCLRHGKGRDNFVIGDEYIGEYVLGKAEGYG